MNSVKLEGNIGKNKAGHGLSPFKTQEQVAGVRFSLAVNHSGRGNDPTWITCFAYGTVASNILASGAGIGTRVYVEGELRPMKDNELCVYIQTGNLKGKSNVAENTPTPAVTPPTGPSLTEQVAAVLAKMNLGQANAAGETSTGNDEIPW